VEARWSPKSLRGKSCRTCSKAASSSSIFMQPARMFKCIQVCVCTCVHVYVRVLCMFMYRGHVCTCASAVTINAFQLCIRFTSCCCNEKTNTPTCIIHVLHQLCHLNYAQAWNTCTHAYTHATS
jgi:hypothetical protein